MPVWLTVFSVSATLLFLLLAICATTRVSQIRACVGLLVCLPAAVIGVFSGDTDRSQDMRAELCDQGYCIYDVRIMDSSAQLSPKGKHFAACAVEIPFVLMNDRPQLMTSHNLLQGRTVSPKRAGEMLSAACSTKS